MFIISIPSTPPNIFNIYTMSSLSRKIPGSSPSTLNKRMLLIFWRSGHSLAKDVDISLILIWLELEIESLRLIFGSVMFSGLKFSIWFWFWLAWLFLTYWILLFSLVLLSFVFWPLIVLFSKFWSIFMFAFPFLLLTWLLFNRWTSNTIWSLGTVCS